MSRRASRRGLRAAHIAGLALLSTGLVLFGVQAHAVFTEIAETGRPGYLRLGWGPEPQHIAGLRPGDGHYWQIRVSLHDVAAGDLTLTLRADGALVEHQHGLILAIEGCDIPFADVPAAPLCTDGPVSILPPTRLSEVAQAASGDLWALADIGEHREQHLLVHVTAPAAGMGDATLHGLEARVGFGLSSSGGSAPPARILPVTGSETISLLLIASGLMLALPARSALRRIRSEQRSRHAG